MRDLNFMWRAGMRLTVAVIGVACLLLTAANISVASAATMNADPGNNRLLSVTLDSTAAETAVKLQTASPVGYRYTVYDSFDPVRVVIDFPGMAVAGIAPLTEMKVAPLQAVRVSALSLSSGQLGRVEFLLDKKMAYNVSASGNDLIVVFTEAVDSAAASAEMQDPPSTRGSSAGVAASPAAGAAQLLDSVDMQPGRAVLNADGKIDNYRYFTLASPARLVVDLYDVRPLFKERTFAAQQGFSQMRVGTYKDRTRLVFDSDSGILPTYALSEQQNAVVVNWSGAAPASATKPAAKSAAGTVSVDEVNFQKDNGKSQLIIDLSGPAEVIPATLDGSIVRFGVKDATISRSLRRTFDSSSFPSAVLRATPYTVLTGSRQDVRFAVELKGQVSYQLIEQGNRLLFIVDDGAFVEPVAASREQFPVPVATSGAAATPAVGGSVSAYSRQASAEVSVEMPQPIGVTENEQVYTGQKIRLVFDDADVRDIFQLIAEVSDLNIIVSDDVKGAITLRLIDVPWDQALDLILETRNLGMLKKGNVVRILPKDQIRAMEESKFTAARNKEKLEDLVTEVIPVSYTDLKNIEKPSKELLSARGKITADDRNKQIILTDIPSVIDSVKKLITILDTPERQVMIEARIVEASSILGKDLGIAWGVTHNNDSAYDGLTSFSVAGGGSFLIPPVVSASDGVGGIGSALTFGRTSLESTVLDIKLAASEINGTAKVISRPRVTTLNGELAKISQGSQVPYTTVSDNGTNVEWKNAFLSLEVTPVINPDNSIILKIKATNDTPNFQISSSNPPIDTKSAETKVLVMNGETTVIGGAYVESENEGDSGIPYLKDIPYLGMLFKSKNLTKSRAELLIFVTPRIVN
ncbi:type IV pilus secretin PilQ [Trichloromonas sp.]|uniref:type IV pilus secretin PilQ n=1 Tax=Trichloromonas sp. TaxID=3069249 RepID=UPI003D813411